ncbi:uncharacterized protein LOC123217531 isoform X2 [Mangifera indica]|uniref:uncharacterized protein LOC123217531 isoform X2 n=1 Tax=Mangifera indica TaxID=29780 RepID=UPI001CFA2D6A|nr:uncharacterized protein LOC123217531 isoform X2 [Mangifera indica]
MPARGSSRFIAPSIHSLYKPPFLTQLHHHTFTTSLLETMPGRQNRRGRRNARRLDFPPDFVPKGWFIINEINKDGVEEALQPGRPLIYCTHCRNMGHEAHRCGFSEEYVRLDQH